MHTCLNQNQQSWQNSSPTGNAQTNNNTSSNMLRLIAGKEKADSTTLPKTGHHEVPTAVKQQCS